MGSFGLWDIDLLITQSQKNTQEIIEEQVEFNDFWDKFLMDYNGENIGVIEYSEEQDNILYVSFLWTINGQIDEMIDMDFLEKFNSYFWESETYLKNAWKKIFWEFLKLKKWFYQTVELKTVNYSEGFYNKILQEFEEEWIINLFTISNDRCLSEKNIIFFHRSS